MISTHRASLPSLLGDAGALSVDWVMTQVRECPKDYAALTPGKEWESFWVIRLGQLGNNRREHQPGTKPVFMMYCHDDKGFHRTTQKVTGLPNAKSMLGLIHLNQS